MPCTPYNFNLFLFTVCRLFTDVTFCGGEAYTGNLHDRNRLSLQEVSFLIAGWPSFILV